MNKRVIVILAIIFVIASIFIINNSPTSHNLTEQFNMHGRVIDYGVIENNNEISVIEKIYESYEQNPEGTIYIVFGDKNEVKVSSFEELAQGNINLITGEKNLNTPITKDQFFSRIIKPINNKVRVLINGKGYEFDLDRTEKLYFVVRE